MIKDFKLSDAQPEKCDHRTGSKKCTLVYAKGLHFMTYPRQVFAVCTCCGKSFEFVQDEDGKIRKITATETIKKGDS